MARASVPELLASLGSVRALVLLGPLATDCLLLFSCTVAFQWLRHAGDSDRAHFLRAAVVQHFLVGCWLCLLLGLYYTQLANLSFADAMRNVVLDAMRQLQLGQTPPGAYAAKLACRCLQPIGRIVHTIGHCKLGVLQSKARDPHRAVAPKVRQVAETAAELVAGVAAQWVVAALHNCSYFFSPCPICCPANCCPSCSAMQQELGTPCCASSSWPTSAILSCTAWAAWLLHRAVQKTSSERLPPGRCTIPS